MAKQLNIVFNFLSMVCLQVRTMYCNITWCLDRTWVGTPYILFGLVRTIMRKINTLNVKIHLYSWLIFFRSNLKVMIEWHFLKLFHCTLFEGHNKTIIFSVWCCHCFYTRKMRRRDIYFPSFKTECIWWVYIFV